MVLSLTLLLFTLAFLILGLTGALELVFQGSAFPSWAEPFTIGLVGATCLLLGAVPYFLWLLSAGEKRK
jgi:hypothetical protein